MKHLSKLFILALGVSAFSHPAFASNVVAKSDLQRGAEISLSEAKLFLS